MNKFEKIISINKSDTAPSHPNVEELRKAAKCVYIITEENVAKDLADKLHGAANMIEELQDLAIWMSGCGYPFSSSDYFCKKRDELLLEI